MQIIVWLSSSSPDLDMSPPQWFFKHHPVSFSWGTRQNIFTISLNSATGQRQANEDLCVYIQDWQPDWALDAYLWGGEEKDGGASQWRSSVCSPNGPNSEDVSCQHTCLKGSVSTTSVCLVSPPTSLTCPPIFIVLVSLFCVLSLKIEFDSCLSS